MKKSLGFIFLAVLLAACNGNESNGDLEEVSVVLDWTPNTNHTGLYVAQDQGYFEEEGLDVSIELPGESGADQIVASGQAEFGISFQENITEARVQDVPIVSIGAIIQHNTSGFASPVDKEITSPSDFEGKQYGGWGSTVEEAVLSSVMNEDGADVDEVDIVNIGNTDFFTAVERDVDFAWIYYGWTGIEAEIRDEPINMIYLTDYSESLDYYTPVLATSEDMVEDNPETVQKFMNAAAKGYEFAIENRDDAADILIEAEPDLDPELVKESQKWLSPRYQDDADQWGYQKQEVWENYADWMYERDLLEEPLDVEASYTNEFLPEED
ncbi:ABC transporter substrate-binding protein [Aquisalibacillus elongatus]|uniref:ABC-type nitrate/sulfonate/bicarbonate transport system substrate-binding protein n=1 Tax=Aquisalibacillus elongatus TaxID=485577 RepID=A0A3N5AZC0_9BACI|nr:ABC transporter substrate-binding protein [Aquisalibacillus elongatus]RPF50626.1 ABC-type nitrate/sulfonate/bicarbonate transport system substrate-binding protein [Aquisalibacillus elongatus]